jgi:uncharacterized membrane protein
MGKIFKKISLVLLIIMYLLAGANHFIKPAMYYPIIPPYFPWPSTINILSGLAEILLAILLIFKATRRFAAIGIVILLTAFIPAHIYMIQKGGCMSADVCIPAWAAWLRLFPLQFILMYWAWINRNY